MTAEDVRLYRRAAKLLNRLVNVTELEGEFSGDVVTSETRKLITDWLADYKKEIKKV
jgi:hypothetical protein